MGVIHRLKALNKNQLVKLTTYICTMYNRECNVMQKPNFLTISYAYPTYGELIRIYLKEQE